MRKDYSTPLHERIRRRREERGIPAYALAQRLEISPSYMSLIESGKKVPGEDIARRIAEVLDDDVEMYVAWAHASGINDLDRYAGRLMRLRAYSSDPVLRRRLMSGADLSDNSDDSLLMREPPTARRSFASKLFKSRVAPDPAAEQEPLAVIPFLKEGADPRGEPLAIAGAPLRLDARLVPEPRAGQLFAYRATPETAKRAGGSVNAGDWLILTSHVEASDLQGVLAVRTKDRIALGQVLLKGNALLLLPSPGSSDFDIVELHGEADLARVLAGRVIMTLRGA